VANWEIMLIFYYIEYRPELGLLDSICVRNLSGALILYTNCTMHIAIFGQIK
jgi:hypothetical protein